MLIRTLIYTLIYIAGVYALGKGADTLQSDDAVDKKFSIITGSTE